MPNNTKFDDFAETTAFRQVAKIITALSTQDERIADEFRAILEGRVSSGKIVEIDGDIPLGTKMKLTDFAEAISTRIWNSVGRANWRSFDEARKFVRKLGLKSHVQWWHWSSGKLKGPNVVACPLIFRPARSAFTPNIGKIGQIGWGTADELGAGAPLKKPENTLAN